MSPKGAGEWGWKGDAASLDWDYHIDPHRYNYSIAYARARQLGVGHEEAVQSAQRQTYGQVRSQYPEPENERNRNWGMRPLYSNLPPVESAAGRPNSVVRFSPGREQMAGDRLMKILAVASMMGGAGAGAVAEVYDQDGSQF